MTILSTLRDRLSPSTASAESNSATDAEGDPVVEAGLPFAGYDGLNDRDVLDGLSDHSQVELEAAESYERSHKDRTPVLDKLRYLRGPEPFEGYDGLSISETVTALKDADMPTIKKVRNYERKFGNRRDVLEEVVRVHHERRAGQPASAPAG